MINFILGFICGLCILKLNKKWYVDYRCKKIYGEKRKLYAIREYRRLTGKDLKESKEYIENLCDC